MNAAVLTVTLNPSIDVSTTTETLTPEHKLRCADVRREPGGGGINVARVLKRLGADCHALYPAGGVLGRLLERELDQALEATFPASDPVAVDTLDEHEGRRKYSQRKDSRQSK